MRIPSAARRLAWLVGLPFRALIVGALLAYRRTFRGVASGRCRFYPSCSTYALDAVRAHGAVKGTALAVWRVLRCSPLSRGGIDPVPARRAAAEYEAVIQQPGEAA